MAGWDGDGQLSVSARAVSRNIVRANRGNATDGTLPPHWRTARSCVSGRAGEIATELAVHFEQGRDYHRAIHFLQRAGENALRHSASTEAITHLNKALELLKTLPDTPERT